MTDTISEDPATIEREIRQTQDDMSRTVDKIGDQLSVKKLFNALLDKADESNVDARTLVDGARRNPIALGLIAAGAIWLVSDKDSKLPSLPSKSKGSDPDDLDVHHRDYVSHMSMVEQRAEEDALTYQRRRDAARSSFFMVERNHDEDDSTFRQRLDEVANKFREKRRAWSDSTNEAQVAGKQKARAAAGKAQDLYSENPMVGGLLAAALGAAIGAALPVTRQEQEKLGGLGEKAREKFDENKDQISSQLRDKKDELLEKADAALKPSTDKQVSHEGSEPMEQPFMSRS